MVDARCYESGEDHQPGSPNAHKPEWTEADLQPCGPHPQLQPRPSTADNERLSRPDSDGPQRHGGVCWEERAVVGM